MKNTLALFASLVLIMNSCQSPQPVTPETLERIKEGSRQIHLDFHTSEAIDKIGFKFDKKEFQAALLAGNVNSINIFGKGHHSWCYYPTEAGSVHPGLDFDLLGKQIEACHEIGVTAQVYITVGWSANDALVHPEWTIVDQSGTNSYIEMMKDLGPDDPFGWGFGAAAHGRFTSGAGCNGGGVALQRRRASDCGHVTSAGFLFPSPCGVNTMWSSPSRP